MLNPKDRTSWLALFLQRPWRERLGLRGGRRRALERQVAALPSSAAALDRAAGAVERRFVAVGSVFRDQVLLNQKLVREGERFIELFGERGEDSAGLVAAQRLVRETLRFAEEGVEGARRLSARFRDCREQVEGVLRAETQLAKTYVPLQIIERLFRIEAAALPSDRQTVFEALTQEIAALHREMRSTLSQQFQSLADTRRGIDNAITGLEERSKELQERVDATRQRIDAALGSLDAQIAANRGRSERLTRETRAIAEEASEVMVGLQYQDVMRQRADHVGESLKELARRSEARRADGLELEFPLVRRVCEIQVRQIESIGDGLASAARSIEQGIGSLFERLQRIDRHCLPLAELRQAIASEEAMVDALVASLEDAQELVELSLAGAFATYRSVESFSGIAMNVTAALERLTFDIKLIALNAQIQAAQMGEGTGLEVLSEQTCELSEQTGGFTHEIGRDLDRLVGAMGEAVAECGAFKSSAESQLRSLQARGGQLRSSLLGHRADAASSIEALAELLRRSRDNAQAMRKSARFDDLSDSALSRARDELRSIVEQARALRSGARDDAEAAQTLASLGQGYTMDAERRIHESVVGGAAPDPAPRASPRAATLPLAPAAPAPAGDLGDNVELF